MDNTTRKIEFIEFISNLTKRLKMPLPGEIAHKLMAAKSRLSIANTPNATTRKSAILILFYPFEDKINIPLILRPQYDGMHGGQVAFPGGRYEKTDENLIRTAIREAQEEIGIRATDVQVIGQLTELYIPPSNFLVQPVVGFMNKKPAFYPDPREVDTIFEISVDEIMNPEIITEELLNVRGVEVQAPIYSIQNHKVWGATAMMIAELLMVLDWEE
jgi:8-oxo-dGTP pyrophosphatase MutT (NUDIX family)